MYQLEHAAPGTWMTGKSQVDWIKQQGILIRMALTADTIRSAPGICSARSNGPRAGERVLAAMDGRGEMAAKVTGAIASRADRPLLPPTAWPRIAG
jgi:hypothetical protein